MLVSCSKKETGICIYISHPSLDISTSNKLFMTLFTVLFIHLCKWENLTHQFSAFPLQAYMEVKVKKDRAVSLDISF